MDQGGEVTPTEAEEAAKAMPADAARVQRVFDFPDFSF